MKALITVMFFFFTCLGFSQRVQIDGEIKVPEGKNPDGITVMNTTAGQATISNERGFFQIRVAAGDTLSFNSLQFQDFLVIVDEGIVNSRELNVFVSEAVTELPEVVVTPYDLSGNVRVDVAIIPVNDLDLPTESAAEINTYEWEFRPDEKDSPPNAAMRTSMIYNGTNFANIFRNLFGSDEVISEVERNEAIDEKLREIKDDDFYEEQLNIEEEHLKEFLYFAADSGLTQEMLEPENEMELIEYLITQSKRFNQLKTGDQ